MTRKVRQVSSNRTQQIQTCKPRLMILRRIGLSVGERPLLLGAGSRRVGCRGLSFMLSDNYDVDPAI
jgi:hypothetical protein